MFNAIQVFHHDTELVLNFFPCPVAKAQYWQPPVCYDDDDDEESSNSLNDNISELLSFSAITPDEPVLSIEAPDNSLSMGDEHLNTIPATESDEFIKSGVENLIPIPSESEGIPEHVCDVPSHDNSPPLDASPPDSELVSSEVMEIVIPEVGGIKASNDNPIPSHDSIISGNPPNLTPSGESEFFSEVDAFLAVEDESTSSQFPKSDLDPEGDMLLFESFLNDDHSFESQTKSSSTFLNSLLEETNNFHNSLPECTTFSHVLCDAECESDSNDDQSPSDEDVLEKIVSKPLCEKEIIPMKSLRTHDSSLLISSKIDSLLEEFADELTLLKSIPPRIDKAACDFEEDIRLIEKLLVIMSNSKEEMMVDINETLERLRAINLKLNLNKFSFGVKEGVYSGHLIKKQGIRADPSKVKAVSTLQPPKTVSEMQNLNKKITALNRFLSKRAERILPFMKILRSCTSGKMGQWMKEVDEAFQRMKECLESLPTMVIPTKGETLTMYLTTSEEIVSTVLMAERGKKQIPVYFVSRTLHGAELKHPELEKLILALVYAARKLRRYFQAHPIQVLNNKPIKQILEKPEKSGRISKWAIELGEHEIEFRGRNPIKGQILADFLAETPLLENKEAKDKEVKRKEPEPENA
nr:putative reverse transcriptase domain, ribonuclease H-like domain protein [Tanacetum cinerariifolium]